MQDNYGLKRLFSVSWIYDQFQNLIGAKYLRRWLAVNYWKLNKGDKIVDLGCGPGVILNYIPEDVTYVGVDISKDYIRVAKKKFGQKATFIVSTARELLNESDSRLNNADLVMCNGLLHHLDDEEAIEILSLSKEIMGPKGRLVCIEPTFLIHQSRIAKWIMNKDRGRNIRCEKEWKEIVGNVFDSFETSIITSLIRLPYIHIVIHCRNEN